MKLLLYYTYVMNQQTYIFARIIDLGKVIHMKSGLIT